MPSEKSLDQLAQLAVDPEKIVSASRGLAVYALQEVYSILQTGTPAAKITVLRSFIPALIRATAETEQTENEDITELRKMLNELYEEMGVSPGESVDGPE